MARDKKREPDELWVVQGGKPPKKVDSVGEGFVEISGRGEDAKILRARGDDGKTHKTESTVKKKWGKK